MQHDHRPGLPAYLGHRVVDPTRGVTPIARQDVPQHACVPRRAQRRRTEWAHQPIIDDSTGTVRAEEQPVAAALIDRSCRADKFVGDDVVLCRAELHRVTPGVPTQPVTFSDDSPAQSSAVGGRQLAADREEGRRH